MGASPHPVHGSVAIRVSCGANCGHRSADQERGHYITRARLGSRRASRRRSWLWLMCPALLGQTSVAAQRSVDAPPCGRAADWRWSRSWRGWRRIPGQDRPPPLARVGASGWPSTSHTMQAYQPSAGYRRWCRRAPAIDAAGSVAQPVSAHAFKAWAERRGILFMERVTR